MTPTSLPARADRVGSAIPEWGRGSANASDRKATLTLIAIAAIWLAGLALYLPAEVNHDSAWYLTATRSWLFHGAELYVDIVELNPPLAFYLTAPPVFAAEALGIADGLAFKLYLLALAAASCALTVAVLRATEASTGFVAAYAGAALAVALFGALPNFGEREHFLVLLALPYLTAAAAAPLGLSLSPGRRAGLAALACLGLFIKPHYLLAPLAISATRCWRERSWRPLFGVENWTIAGCALAYLGVIATAHPAYLGEIVPLTRTTYWAYGLPPSVLLPYQVGLLALAGVLAVSLSRKNGDYARMSELLLAATLGFLLALVLQNKGFSYHRIPAQSSGALAAMVALYGVLERRGSEASTVRCSGLAVACAVLIFALPGTYRSRFTDELRRELGRELQGKSVLGLSVFIEPYFPFVTEAGARWAGRYPCLWPLRASALLAKSDDPAERRAAEQVTSRLKRDVAADLRANKPDYVLSERRYGPEGIDYVAFLKSEPAFAAEWRRYRLVDRFGIFEVWRREPIEAPPR